MSNTVTSVLNNGKDYQCSQAELNNILLSTGNEKFQVEWDSQAKVTPMGSLEYFAQFRLVQNHDYNRVS